VVLPGAPISGLRGSDAVVLGSVAYAPGGSVTVAGDTVTIEDGGSSYVLDIVSPAPVPAAPAAAYGLSDVGGALALVPCYAAGTRIATLRGAVAVEDIIVGDRILLGRLNAAEATRPVIWTGRRRLDLTRHAAPAQVLPVRILAGAFGPGLPARDLLVSPHHAIYDAGHLFEAIALVNGATILQEHAAKSISYHHIELDRHDVMLAEGLPAESFLNRGHRAMFEGQGALTLHPDFRAVADAGFCVPLVRAGAALAALRGRLLARAAAMGCVPAAAALLDIIARGRRLTPVAPGRYALPPDTEMVELRSPIGFAGQTGPQITDERPLGVALRRVSLTIAGRVLPIDLSGGHAGLYPPAAGACWTDGAARLHLTRCPGTALLRIELAGHVDRLLRPAEYGRRALTG
jgi:hypothetical protein